MLLVIMLLYNNINDYNRHQNMTKISLRKKNYRTNISNDYQCQIA